MTLAVFAIEIENNAGSFANGFVDRIETPAEFFERHGFGEREVEVFREAVVAEIATLQGSSPFESKRWFEIRFGQSAEEPCEAIIPFEHALLNAPSAFLRQPVCEKRNIPLR